MHPLFEMLNAERVHVPDAEEAARRALARFTDRPIHVDWRADGTVLVAPAGLEPLLFVTDPTTTWDRVNAK